MSNIYFSSDFHFNHTNICGRSLSSWPTGYRNFSSLSEMNDKILTNLNNKVQRDDILYFLGDFAFGDKKLIPSLRARINCLNVHVVRGNHDKAINDYSHNFSSVQDRIEMRFCDWSNYLNKNNKILFVMDHYPLRVWNEQARGAIHLHGHCHGNLKNPVGKMLDVGVDSNNFEPYSIDDILKIMDKIPVFCGEDHHTEKQKGW